MKSKIYVRKAHHLVGNVLLTLLLWHILSIWRFLTRGLDCMGPLHWGSFHALPPPILCGLVFLGPAAPRRPSNSRKLQRQLVWVGATLNTTIYIQWTERRAAEMADGAWFATTTVTTTTTLDRLNLRLDAMIYTYRYVCMICIYCIIHTDMYITHNIAYYTHIQFDQSMPNTKPNVVVVVEREKVPAVDDTSYRPGIFGRIWKKKNSYQKVWPIRKLRALFSLYY